MPRDPAPLSASAETDGRFATLDGLRGIAALLVAVYHLQQRLGMSAINGFLAVDLFFVLSGLVLTQVYVDRFAGGLSPWQFVGQRIARFYPLYALGLLLGVVVLAVDRSALSDLDSAVQTGAALLFGALLLPTPLGQILFPLNSASWSLFFELVVNLVFALWLWKLPRWLLVVVIVGALGWLAASTTAPLYLNIGWRWAELGGGCARALFSFTAGMLICRLLPTKRAQRSPVVFILPLFAMAPIIVTIGDPTVWTLGTVALLFPAVVTIAALIEPPTMARRAFEALGALSFPLYAIHWPLAALMAPWLRGLPVAIAVAVFATAALGLAHLAQRLVDAPAQDWLKARRRAPRHQAQLTTTSPLAP